MKKLVAANWKMNPKTADEARRLISSYEHFLRHQKFTNVEVVVAVPFVYLPTLAKFASNVKLAAQNMSWAKEGPLTGEISALQLKEAGVTHVILGHSERRIYLGETDSVVSEKIVTALKYGLTPIVCLGGETGAIKSEMRTLLTKQFIRLTVNLDKQQLAKIIYVYEPVWAISTMKHSQPATGEHAAEMIDHIYDLLQKHLGKKARTIQVIYGGTVNKNIVQEYSKYPQIGGALVGAASLDPENFEQVIAEFNREALHKA
jgi:triosephosphate isomerase